GRARGRAPALRGGHRRASGARGCRRLPAPLHRLPGSARAGHRRAGARGGLSAGRGRRAGMFVVDWLHKQAQHHPDKLALVDVASGRSFRYRDFDERASRFAEWLREHWRLAPGDRLAVLAHNGSDYLEMLYGCAKAGVVMVCLNWRLPAPELQPIVDDAAPAAFVCSEEFVPVARQVFQGLPGLVCGTHAADWPAYESALAAASGEVVEMPTRGMDETWYLLYTSGTTGRPKGVIQTFGMAFFNAVNAMLATKLSG